MELAKFDNLYDKFIDIKNELKTECLKLIKEALAKNNNNIDLTQVEDFLMISYDGGNDPEDSSMFACVKEVGIDNVGIYILIEGTPDVKYPIEMVLTDDLAELVEFLDKWQDEYRK